MVDSMILCAISIAIGLFDQKIDRVFRSSEPCQRIAKIKGVGPKTGTTIIAAAQNSRRSPPRRLGLTRATTVLQRRSHYADGHLKAGQPASAEPARSRCTGCCTNGAIQDGANNACVNQLRQRRGFNRATVAVANKKTRIIWTASNGEPYRAVF